MDTEIKDTVFESIAAIADLVEKHQGHFSIRRRNESRHLSHRVIVTIDGRDFGLEQSFSDWGCGNPDEEYRRFLRDFRCMLASEIDMRQMV